MHESASPRGRSGPVHKNQSSESPSSLVLSRTAELRNDNNKLAAAQRFKLTAALAIFCALSPFQALEAQEPLVMPRQGFEGGAPPPKPIKPPVELTPITPQMLDPTRGAKPKTLMGLVEAFDEALLAHPRVASIRGQLGIARAQYAQALTLPNPSLFIYEGQRAEQTFQRGASIPIEPPWKLATRLLVAKRQVKQTDLQIMQSLWQLRNDVRRAYLEVVVAQETVQTLGELKDLAEKLLSVAQKRFQAGDVPELDVLKARLATSQTEIDYNQGIRRVSQAKQQLNVMLGRSYQGEVEVQRLPILKGKIETNDLLPNFDQPVPDEDQFMREALATRLELKVVAQQIKVAKAGLYDAVGNIIPNFQMNVGDSATGNPPNGPKIKGGYFIGIQQELPVLNFQQGPIAGFNSQIKQLKLELSSQRNVITGQVASAFQKLIAARERIKAYHDHVLNDSNEVARLARRSYEVGQADITSTLAAQQNNVQIRSQYLDAVQAYQQAFADLEQALGRPLQ